MSSLLPLNYRCPRHCFQTNKNQRLGYIRSTSSQYKYKYFDFTQMMQYSILQTNRKTSQASHSVKCTTNETYKTNFKILTFFSYLSLKICILVKASNLTKIRDDKFLSPGGEVEGRGSCILYGYF